MRKLALCDLALRILELHCSLRVILQVILLL